MRQNILMNEYFEHDRKFLHNRDECGIVSKTVSTISPTTQTPKICFEIEHASHLRDTSDYLLFDNMHLI